MTSLIPITLVTRQSASDLKYHTVELLSDKTNDLVFESSEDSDKTGHLPSLN